MRIHYHDTLGENLYPLTILESPLDLLIGTSSLRDKCSRILGEVEFINSMESQPEDLGMYGLWSISAKDWKVLSALKMDTSLWIAETCIAKRGTGEAKIQVQNGVLFQHSWDLFLKAGKALQLDSETLAWEKALLHNSNTEIGNKGVFAKGNFKAFACVFNTSNGPIYLEEGVEIMEGSTLRGPLFFGKNAQVKMGAKIYGPSYFGEECRIGGEVSNAVFQAFSNKGHDGFLGNSCIGRWCNLGADTNSSNLKNNYSPVSVYSYSTKSMEKTGMQFCGLLMGDHSKTGINTMLNTATTVGCFSNLFGANFPPKHIQSFSWGSNEVVFELNKAFEMAELMMKRRSMDINDEYRAKIEAAFSNRQAL
ncbi:MAG: UDP-N-acetylglucosamine diphosphorylase/glucosamine-1-phosphate N-acetyltransferase [Luteibaculaceae bacterium]|jgi:UDP-N-acetylglucosamine diphosphorylase/glucosamine-1-phosphate N-acetyltransferase